MKMKNQIESSTIYESEIALFENLRKTYPEEIRDRIVDDGLCWAAISNKMPDKSNRNWPECLWTESKRRVLFLLKEPNGNEGEDYKDWDWSEGSEIFGNVLAYWLEGIMTTRIDYCPKYSEISSRKDIFKKYPLAIVNSKKIAGGSSANWNTIWEYVERDKLFLRTQINSEADILLIDSYHPSLIMNEQEKIEGLINGFHDFILKTNYRY